MSLSILDQPAETAPAYNDMTYKLSTTEAAQPNFFVRAKVRYWDGSNFTQIGTYFDIFPIPNSNNIIFNPNRILRNQLDNDLAILMGSTTTGQASAIGEQYMINFQEYYGNTPQASGTEVSGTAYVFNGALERREYANYDVNDFVINATQLARFITPVDEIWLQDSDTYLLTIMSDVTGGTALVTKLRYERFDITGSSLGTSDISMLSPETAVENRFQSVRIHIPTISSYNTEYIDIWAANAANTQRTEKLRIWIDRTCSKYEVQKIYFLNRFGGIDMINFPLVSRNTVLVDRSQYNRPVGNDEGDNWNLYTYDRQRTTFATKLRNRMVLNTGYLNDTQAILLKDLVTSPSIWWYDGEFVSMNMERDQYETKKQINDGLIQEEIVLTESLENTRQRC